MKKLTIYNKNSNFIKSLVKGGGKLVDEKIGPQILVRSLKAMFT